MVDLFEVCVGLGATKAVPNPELNARSRDTRRFNCRTGDFRNAARALTIGVVRPQAETTYEAAHSFVT
jgi:hypothetical protein